MANGPSSNAQRLGAIVIKTLEAQGTQPFADLLGALAFAHFDILSKAIRSVGFVQLPSGMPNTPPQEHPDAGPS